MQNAPAIGTSQHCEGPHIARGAQLARVVVFGVKALGSGFGVRSIKALGSGLSFNIRYSGLRYRQRSYRTAVSHGRIAFNSVVAQIVSKPGE